MAILCNRHIGHTNISDRQEDPSEARDLADTEVQKLEELMSRYHRTHSPPHLARTLTTSPLPHTHYLTSLAHLLAHLSRTLTTSPRSHTYSCKTPRCVQNNLGKRNTYLTPFTPPTLISLLVDDDGAMSYTCLLVLVHCTHAYIHTYIHTYMHAPIDMHTYVRTHI